MNNDAREPVKALVMKARGAEKADDALKYSQAACNVANAAMTLFSIDCLNKENTG